MIDTICDFLHKYFGECTELFANMFIDFYYNLYLYTVSYNINWGHIIILNNWF